MLPPLPSKKCVDPFAARSYRVLIAAFSLSDPYFLQASSINFGLMVFEVWPPDIQTENDRLRCTYPEVDHSKTDFEYEPVDFMQQAIEKAVFID